MLDRLEESDFMKVYCSCGRIVDLDRASAETKFRLRKGVQCAVCRNSRIARELDDFDGFQGESPAGT